jgi:hypothetical protein
MLLTSFLHHITELSQVTAHLRINCLLPTLLNPLVPILIYIYIYIYIHTYTHMTHSVMLEMLNVM